jgi:hypothetical protein
VLHSLLKAATKKLKQIKVQEHSIEESTQGKYLPFRKIWEEEGMDQLGFEALPRT